MVGHSHSPIGAGAVYILSDIPVAAGLAIGNLTQGFPYLLLEWSAVQQIGNIKVFAVALKVFPHLICQIVCERSGHPLIRWWGGHRSKGDDKSVLLFNAERTAGKRIDGKQDYS